MATSTQPPILLAHPLLNSIPDNLLSRFEPKYVEYYNKYSAGRLATHQVPIEAYRADPLKYTTQYGREIIDTRSLVITEQQCPVTPAIPTNGVENDTTSEITTRIFQPDPKLFPAPPTGRPAYVNFHGGGWVFGGLATDVDFCKRLCHELGVVCFDVDYRLAPEYKFPIPVNDCWEAFNWILQDKKEEFVLDLNKVAIGGCSAGGHISAVVAHMCRDASIPLAFQLLTVPVCDMHMFSPTGELLPNQPYQSYREFFHTQPLPSERMSYFHNHFLGCPRMKELDEGENVWKMSPIRAKRFDGLAPALVVTAEMDVLRDEGEVYAKKINEGGSKAEVVRIKGAPHTVMQLDGILEGGKEYNRVAVKALREALL